MWCHQTVEGAPFRILPKPILLHRKEGRIRSCGFGYGYSWTASSLSTKVYDVLNIIRRCSRSRSRSCQIGYQFLDWSTQRRSLECRLIHIHNIGLSNTVVLGVGGVRMLFWSPRCKLGAPFCRNKTIVHKLIWRLSPNHLPNWGKLLNCFSQPKRLFQTIANRIMSTHVNPCTEG